MDKEIKELSELFNVLRMREYNQSFKRKEIQELLVKNNFPKHNSFVSILANVGALTKSGNRSSVRYKFTEEPVLASTLRRAYQALDVVLEKHRQYCRKYKKTQPKLTEEEAIKLLKSLNYIIKKQVITYEEV